ncbi:MAG: hypothetical protein ACW981_18350 [Candidatus Hodarchaeales archaeon]|jgi:hypothetical protein
MIENYYKGYYTKYYSKLNLDPEIKRSLKNLVSFRDNYSDDILFDIEFENYENSDKLFIKYLSIRNYSKFPLPDILNFGDIFELIILDHSSNSSFYDSVFSNINMSKLNLSLVNYFSLLPDNFDVFSELIELSIQIPNLKEFPHSIQKLKKLKNLMLITSFLTEIPNFLHELESKLESLTIGNLNKNYEKKIKNQCKNLEIPEIIFEYD